MIIVSIVGDDVASAYLAGMIARVLDLKPAFEKIGDHFRIMIEGQFAGGAWAPLKPYTIAWKGHATKLIHTDGMHQSWVTKGAPGNISRETARTGMFGSDHGLVHWHQWGTSRMVARSVDTSPTAAFNSQVVNEISDWIMNG